MVAEVARRLFTVQEYHQMAEAGILAECEASPLHRGGCPGSVDSGRWSTAAQSISSAWRRQLSVGRNLYSIRYHHCYPIILTCEGKRIDWLTLFLFGQKPLKH